MPLAENTLDEGVKAQERVDCLKVAFCNLRPFSKLDHFLSRSTSRQPISLR